MAVDQCNERVPNAHLPARWWEGVPIDLIEEK